MPNLIKADVLVTVRESKHNVTSHKDFEEQQLESQLKGAADGRATDVATDNPKGPASVQGPSPQD